MSARTYTLIRSRRKTIALTITRDATLVVRAPIRTPLWFVERLLVRKQNWILRTIERVRKAPPSEARRSSKREYAKYKEVVRELVTRRLEYFNQFYNFTYKRVAIRNQKTRWGSCSKDGNLNFNYKLALLPPEQADYIIVHELCHLREFNHSAKFWALVAKTVPNYREIRRVLKRGSIGLY